MENREAQNAKSNLIHVTSQILTWLETHFYGAIYTLKRGKKNVSLASKRLRIRKCLLKDQGTWGQAQWVSHLLQDMDLFPMKSHPAVFTFLYIHLYVFFCTAFGRKTLLRVVLEVMSRTWQSVLKYLKGKKPWPTNYDDDNTNIYWMFTMYQTLF